VNENRGHSGSESRAVRAGEELDWVRRSQTGDREAFACLIKRYERRILKAAGYLMGNYEDAVDVAQDVFLKAYRGIGSFRGEASFETWLVRILTNTAMSYRSRSRAKKRSATVVSLNPGNPGGSEGAIEVADREDGPVDNLMRRELREAIEGAIRTLDWESRTVVVMRDIQGYSYDAIGEILGHPIGTVKSKIHRARLALRAKLGGYL